LHFEKSSIILDNIYPVSSGSNFEQNKIQYKN
jgi:hypothetical protein